MSKKRWIAFGFTALLVFYFGAYLLSIHPDYDYQKKILPQDFNPYYQFKLKESRLFRAIPGTEEKLVRFAEKSKFAILYIHGFGANRKEGEGFTDMVAQKYKFNTYYLRLPGHGTNKEDHAKRKFTEFLNEAEDALHMTQKLGDNVIIFATSMGAAIASYLAAKYNDTLVKGLVLFSPFYDFADKTARILDFPGGKWLAQLIVGELRKTNTDQKVEYIKSGYMNFNYPEQYTRALTALNDLRNFVASEDALSQIKVPTVMFYYYRDDENQDTAASVAAMKKAFSKLPGHPGNRLVAIENGNHVLASEYIRSDKNKMLAVVEEFFLQNFSVK